MASSFAGQVLRAPEPRCVYRDVDLPRRQAYHPSPADWRDEVLYFLLVDRFSDGREGGRPLLDRGHPQVHRPAGPGGAPWRWDRWAESGADRWQGGTLAGVASKLGYLRDLGISTLWLSPVFRQRGNLDTYHGYGIQNFLEVDPRFGTRRDLVDLVDQAHAAGIRIILDIIFNHSGFNWLYPDGGVTPPYRPAPECYPFGAWIDGAGAPMGGGPVALDEGVWPAELQAPDCYTRAGMGDLGAGSLDDSEAEHKRTDFFTLRDFALSSAGTLSALARCYAYWIALTDCDGFRIDTLKHVSYGEARDFCGAIKEYAANLGKSSFLLVGEVAGGDYNQDRYLDILGRNLDGALDIGEGRLAVNGVAKGLLHPDTYFNGFDEWYSQMGSHRNLGQRHVSILDDHDHVFGTKIRFSSEAATDHQVVAGVALQLFTLGIPCVYYGTEQALAGPEAAERVYLPGWKGGDHADRYLREAMFGPEHPRRSGTGSLVLDEVDDDLPGFGPFGTAGAHCFDPEFATYRRIAAMGAVRRRFPVLRVGRQYRRPISNFGDPFAVRGPGEIVAWSRILSDEEALCVVNVHGLEPRGGDVVVDAGLNPPGSFFEIVLNTHETANRGSQGVTHPLGSRVPVLRREDGTAYLAIRNVLPSEVLVLVNRP